MIELDGSGGGVGLDAIAVPHGLWPLALGAPFLPDKRYIHPKPEEIIQYWIHLLALRIAQAAGMVRFALENTQMRQRGGLAEACTATWSIDQSRVAVGPHGGVMGAVKLEAEDSCRPRRSLALFWGEKAR